MSLQPRVISSLLGPNVLPSTLFSNTLSLCPFPEVTNIVGLCNSVEVEVLIAPRWQNHILSRAA
jgi:hypothetical protein